MSERPFGPRVGNGFGSHILGWPLIIEIDLLILSSGSLVIVLGVSILELVDSYLNLENIPILMSGQVGSYVWIGLECLYPVASHSKFSEKILSNTLWWLALPEAGCHTQTSQRTCSFRWEPGFRWKSFNWTASALWNLLKDLVLDARDTVSNGETILHSVKKVDKGLPGGWRWNGIFINKVCQK